MPPKKASAPGIAALQPLDPNQETLSLRETQSQKRKATSPTLQEEELDQEIRDMEIIHQQVQREKEKMAQLADLQRKIDEATEEVCHLVQDEQDRRPNTRSFVKKAYSTRLYGMMILIMMPLLLMMLLPWQQNCRLPHGPHHTSHISSPCMMDT
jgi:Fe2+ transport system protein B